jgi:hypothetical protein
MGPGQARIVSFLTYIGRKRADLKAVGYERRRKGLAE